MTRFNVSMKGRWNAAFLWTALIGLDTIAQLLFKLAAQGLGQPHLSWRWLMIVAQSISLWGAALSVVLTFPIWMLILRKSQLNLAFPATALTYVGVIGGSRLFFGEPIYPMQFLGIVLIVVGVSLMRAVHDRA
jgi:multidrug transporter EmrE-like cation transporter